MEFFLIPIAVFVGEDPVPLVKTLVQLEIAAIAEPGGIGPFDEDALARLYTGELAADFRAVAALGVQRNEPTVDGDLITGHQEYCQLRDIQIIAGEETSAEAFVHVRFQSQWCFDAPADVRNEVTAIDFHLVKIDDQWRIDDFQHSLYGSFRALLATFLAE